MCSSDLLSGWSERDRVELASLTRRFSDAVFALLEAHDGGENT